MRCCDADCAALKILGEHGGNCDVKNLSRGSRCFFPVFVEGAGLSLGDLHFSQGDGELSFCGAIEMAGITTLKVDIIKGGVEKFAMTMPVSNDSSFRMGTFFFL